MSRSFFRNLTAHRRLFTSLLVVLVSLALPTLLGQRPYETHILVVVLLNVVLAVTLRHIMVTGQISFAHAAFVAIGAYASALMVTRAGLPFALSLPAAGIVASVIAVALGIPALRIKGPYFFLATLAFVELLAQVFSHWTNPFGGRQGIVGIPPPSFSFFEMPTLTLSSKTDFYYAALVLAVVCVFVLDRIERSRYGMTAKAIGEADILSQSVGVNLAFHKVLAFVFASFFVGLAGAFYAHYYTYINPSMFDFWLSTYCLIYVVVGGPGAIYGPIVGATLLTLVPEALRATQVYQTGIFAVVLILVGLFLPEGLISIPKLGVQKFRLLRRLLRQDA